MEIKKNEKYDLERRRSFFFGIGMIIALSIAITAFEWRTEVEPVVYWVEYESSCFFSKFPILAKENSSEFEPPSTKWKEDGTVITNDPKYKSSSVKSFSDSASITVCGFPFENSIEEVFTIVEEMPSYEGGFGKFHEFIGENIRYPNSAKKFAIEGRVFVQFIVEKDGFLKDLRLIKGIGAECDKEALRVMNLVPNFKPGKQRGQPVRVKMIIPINFTLQ